MRPVRIVLLDGREVLRVLVVAGIGGAALWLVVAYVGDAHAANRSAKTIRFITGEAARRHRAKGGVPLFPRGPHTMSPERYLWDQLARIIRDIGHRRMASAWPYVPPGAPGVGGGTGLPL